MAQLISVKLSRFDGSPWGFRLQGGKDFGSPLIVQKVNGGSLAEQAGLKAGDTVIRVNNTDTFNLRHKDAQDVIVRAGNSFEMEVQRGGRTWRPSVSPVGMSLPSPQPNVPASCMSPVTKTSLAVKKQDAPLIGSGHNFAPKPFINGGSEGPIKSIVNKQYNSPVGIYSEQTIAETLAAQAEVLAGGVLGVNFKKNERNYNAENSEVFKMVQEADKEPKTPEPAEPALHSGVIMPSSPVLAGLRSVVAPETKPQPATTPQSSLPPGQNICADCERLIVGVFVRIKEKNLHVECFKCSTCGTSLKNVGYYNINNKLYCDIHAKLVARQQAPSGLAPIIGPPGGKAPASTISSALYNLGGSAPLSPALSSHGSPQPFTARTYDYTSDDLGDRAMSTSNTDLPVYYATIYEPVVNTTGSSTLLDSSTTARDESDSNVVAPTYSNGKTYTSSITFRTRNEVGRFNDPVNVIFLDDNRNPTNKLSHIKPDESSINDKIKQIPESCVVSSLLVSPTLQIVDNANDDDDFVKLRGTSNDRTMSNGKTNVTCNDREQKFTAINNRETQRCRSIDKLSKAAIFSSNVSSKKKLFASTIEATLLRDFDDSYSKLSLVDGKEPSSDDTLTRDISDNRHCRMTIGRVLENESYESSFDVERHEKFHANDKFRANDSSRFADNDDEYENGKNDNEYDRNNRVIPGYRTIGNDGRRDTKISSIQDSLNGQADFLSIKPKLSSPPTTPTTVTTSLSSPSITQTAKMGGHTTNNLGGPKPFGGSSIIAPSSVAPPPVQNSGGNTLPRHQSQTVTAHEDNSNIPNPEAPKPICCSCNKEIIRGPFITALGQIWCPEHFVCVNSQCRRPLQDIGFVEEKGQLHCEYCFERFIAPECNKCNNKIKGDCLNAVGKQFHPECFSCSYCGKLFGNSPFFMEDGLPYCEADWNELFTTKCYACGFPVEAGDRWVEALNNNYHSQCFNCTMCKKNLEGQSFYAKGGRPFCKNHAR